MHIETLPFGKLEYQPDQVIEFGEGLLGFPDLCRYLKVGPDGYQPLEFLVPLDEPRLAFPLLVPYAAEPAYGFDLDDADRAAIGLPPGGGVLVYCVATFGPSTEEATLNLLAPIVINPATRRGRQVVLEGSVWPVARPLFPRT